jgi:SAM-dependent methyltransferase
MVDASPPLEMEQTDAERWPTLAPRASELTLGPTITMSGPVSLRRQAYLRVWSALNRGDERWCPACDRSVRRFAPYGHPSRRDAQCPFCGSLERHRALWLFLTGNTALLESRLRVLAVAPDPHLERRAGQLPWDYLSIDLVPGKAMRQMDLTRLTLPNADRDLIIAYHVLEHIPDDGAALREIARVLRPGGVALLEVPLAGDETDERFMDAPPQVRAEHYGQGDHVRMYGERDFQRRLARAGLRSTVARVGELFADSVQRAGLMEGDRFFTAEHMRAQGRTPPSPANLRDRPRAGGT